MQVTFSNVRVSISLEEIEGILLEHIKKNIPLNSDVNVKVNFPTGNQKEVTVDLSLKDTVTNLPEPEVKNTPETPVKRPVGRPPRVVETTPTKPIDPPKEEKEEDEEEPEVNPEPELLPEPEPTPEADKVPKKSLFKNLTKG